MAVVEARKVHILRHLEAHLHTSLDLHRGCVCFPGVSVCCPLHQEHETPMRTEQISFVVLINRVVRAESVENMDLS